MKRLTVVGIALVLALAFAFTNLSAQSRQTKVVFVRAQAAILSHPSGERVQDLRQQAEAELGELLASIQELQGRVAAGQQLTAEENERYQALVTSAQAIEERYRQEIDAAAQPAVQAVNAILAQLAEENGYTVILDADKARELDLVVYADTDLDITQLVIDRLNAQ